MQAMIEVYLSTIALPVIYNFNQFFFFSIGYSCYLMSQHARNIHPYLGKVLDWDHEGDMDLLEIADYMLDWENKLSTDLGLAAHEIEDIKKDHSKPIAQR